MSLTKKILIPIAVITSLSGLGLWKANDVVTYNLTRDRLKAAEKLESTYIDSTPAFKLAEQILEDKDGFFDSIFYSGQIRAAQEYKEYIDEMFSHPFGR